MQSQIDHRHVHQEKTFQSSALKIIEFIVDLLQ